MRRPGPDTKKPAAVSGGFAKIDRRGARLLLPSALLVPVGFEALAAFVFRHFQSALFLKISHGV